MPFRTLLLLAAVLSLVCYSCGTAEKKRIIDEKKAESHYQLGISALNSGDMVKAKQQLSIAIENASDIPYYHNHLGIVYLRENDLARAQELFEKAYSLDKTYTDPLNNLGVLFMKKNDLPKAKEMFLKALSDQLYPFPNYIETNLGIISRMEKDYTEAHKHFQKAIKIKGAYCETFKQIALTYDEQGENALAIENYKKTIQLCSDVEALYKGAVKMFIMKDNENGKQFLQKCIEIDAKNTAGLDIPFLKDCVTLATNMGIENPYNKSTDKKQIDGGL